MPTNIISSEKVLFKQKVKSCVNAKCEHLLEQGDFKLNNVEKMTQILINRDVNKKKFGS